MKYPIRFAKYLLLERVNVGGMAEVFKAKTFGAEGFQRFLAIKRILPNMSEDVEFINMFKDEAHLAVQLNHANIVQIYELGKHESQYYIAMEYVAGKDLRRIVEWFRKRKQVMPVPLAAYICSKICEGLDYAHRKLDHQGAPINLVHRDVSPQNILVSFEGDVKVIDFGIAKAADRLSKTQAGVLKGKFGYMSPEQVAGQEIDRRSDLFAVGVLLYEMLTCQRLFVAETDFSTLEKVRQCEIPPMKERNDAIPDELEGVVRKALAKDLDERYQWCSDFNEDLQRFLITDNSIFNGKRLALFMKETFKEDIDIETQRMQEFARILDSDVADTPSFTASGSHQLPDASGSASNFNSEKTEIFDVNNDALASASTKVGTVEEISKPGGSKRTQSGSEDASMQATQALDNEVVSQAKKLSAAQQVPVHTQIATQGGDAGARGRFDAIEASSGGNKRVLMILGGAVALAMMIIGVALFLRFRTVEPDTAWVVFNIEPLGTPLEIYVDDELVASGSTPIDKRRLAVGKHRLRITPKNFHEINSDVEFKLDTTNEISIRLKPAPPPQATPPAEQTPPPSAATGLAQTPPPQPETPPPPPQHQAQTQSPKPQREKPERERPERTEPKPPKKSVVTVEPPAGALGFLVVNTPNEPGTKIFLDGRDTKRETPVGPAEAIKVGAGKHIVTLVFKDGAKKNVAIVVNAGMPPFKLIERK